MGGTALRLTERYHLQVLCATKGERGVPGQAMEVMAAIREQEETAACAMLGAELTFLGLIDGEVFAGQEICERVAALLRQIGRSPSSPSGRSTHTPTIRRSQRSRTRRATSPVSQASSITLKRDSAARRPASVRISTWTSPPYSTSAIRLLRCHACQNVVDGMVQEAIRRAEFRGLNAAAGMRKASKCRCRPGGERRRCCYRNLAGHRGSGYSSCSCSYSSFVPIVLEK